MKPQPKSKTLRSPRFLAYLRTCSCSWCGRKGRSDPAHMGGGGKGIKGPDDRAVPLCRKCHRYSHDHGVMPKRTSFVVLRPEGACITGLGMRTWADGVAAEHVARFLAGGGRL